MSAKPEHYDLIKKPIITEKATMASENGAVVFQVAMDATKPAIKEAVEAVFASAMARLSTITSSPALALADSAWRRPRARNFFGRSWAWLRGVGPL